MDHKNDYIIGKNPVLEAIKSNRDINKIWISEGSQKGSMQSIIQAAKQRKIIIQYVPRKKLDEMVQGTHQGIVAQVASYKYFELDELFKRAEERGEEPFL